LVDDFQDFLRRKQKLVDARLTEVMDREGGIPKALREAMGYSLLAPGKRLRPVLVFLATTVGEGLEEHALPAACAVEMVHTYSLIHDDLPAMDDDDLRRGLPTCHKKYGEAMAILAGDALLTLAFQVLADGYPAMVAAACCRELALGSGAAGMVGGQVEDLVGENATGQRRDPLMPRPATGPSVEALESIHLAKTGALFRACLRMGAWAAQVGKPAGPDLNLLRSLDEFGRCFGLIFQITDDLIDVEGTAEGTGKRTQKDAARGKLTYPGLLGVEESRRRAALLQDQARDIVRSLGAKAQPLQDLLSFVLARDR
jgi:geranylgeranyl diphosphate synthase, type II